ncbi:MAG: DNA polymerase-3 subunit delta [Phenylobacterium sp.]|jgi:DNA polymerase-3 subunit delta
MKIYANQLPQQLSKGLSQVYLIFGDEPLQKAEAMDAIRQAARKQGFTERTSLTADAQFDWNELLVEFNSLSLFSSQKLIELEIDKGKPGKPGSKALTELSALFNPDTILLIHGGKIAGDVQKTKWFKTLQSAGIFIPLYGIDGDHFIRWINQRCQQAGIQLDSEGTRLLASFYTGNLLAAAQEIEKLALGYPNQHISTPYLQSVILNQSKFNAFALVDELLAGNIEQAINILISLQQEGIEPHIVNWALTREVLQLVDMQSLLQSGMSMSQVLQQGKVWSSRQSLISGALSRLSMTQLDIMVADLNTLDTKFKSFSALQPYTDLCHVCLSFGFAEQLSAFALTVD